MSVPEHWWSYLVVILLPMILFILKKVFGNRNQSLVESSD